MHSLSGNTATVEWSNCWMFDWVYLHWFMRIPRNGLLFSCCWRNMAVQASDEHSVKADSRSIRSWFLFLRFSAIARDWSRLSGNGSLMVQEVGSRYRCQTVTQVKSRVRCCVCSLGNDMYCPQLETFLSYFELPWLWVAVRRVEWKTNFPTKGNADFLRWDFTEQPA